MIQLRFFVDLLVYCLSLLLRKERILPTLFDILIPEPNRLTDRKPKRDSVKC